jgi:short-subunit dehydrogenase
MHKRCVMHKWMISIVSLCLFATFFGETLQSDPSRIVLITGASHGIGLATAERLAKNGYKVYAMTRNPSTAADLQALAIDNPWVVIRQLDITDDVSVESAIREILQEEGSIFAVINNAGFGIFGPTETHRLEEIQQLFETNFLGAIRVINAVLPSMRERREGRILNLSSISGVVPSKNLPVYSATKFALEAISASYANDLSPWNIKVTLIQPGPVVTNFESSTCYGTRLAEEENPYLDVLPSRRQSWKQLLDSGQTPDEVAAVIQTVLQDPNPNLWMQTSPSVTAIMENHYKDLSGNVRIPH